MERMNCCICGTVKNCGKYLPKVIENMTAIGSVFQEYQILFFYDTSSDDTLTVLKQAQQTNHRIQIYVNQRPNSPFRTHNLAHARNVCLQFVKSNREKYPYFIMMDCDDVNCKKLHLDVFKQALAKNNWDGLSFNSTPKYYDIWALSIYPFYFSYNHFPDNVKYYDIIQTYIDQQLKHAKIKGEFVPCVSSFNGFSIYRTDKFIHSSYDGRVRTDLLPKQWLKTHQAATKSKLIFQNYYNADGSVHVYGQ
jgi:hypothetical protein